jgi:ADP-ribosylglycohydrolase
MPAVTPDLLERACGALVGAAVGDAFGMPLEGAPRQPLGAQTRTLRRGRLPAGHFTERTGVLLTVSEVLLADTEGNLEALAAQLKTLSNPATSRPALGLRSGARPAAGPEAGTADERSQINVLLCGLPVAFYYAGDRGACLSQVRTLVTLCGQPPECMAAAAFLAAFLWHLLRGMALRQAMQQALLSCSEMPDDLGDTIRRAPWHIRDQLTTRACVHDLLRNAIWGLINTAFFSEALTRVANLGGCTTAACTITGALAGAAYRNSGIPADWRTQVHGNWPPRSGITWREKELAALAQRLLGLPADPPRSHANG